jgi:hypothetical protein
MWPPSHSLAEIFPCRTFLLGQIKPKASHKFDAVVLLGQGQIKKSSMVNLLTIVKYPSRCPECGSRHCRKGAERFCSGAWRRLRGWSRERDAEMTASFGSIRLLARSRPRFRKAVRITVLSLNDSDVLRRSSCAGTKSHHHAACSHHGRFFIYSLCPASD